MTLSVIRAQKFDDIGACMALRAEVFMVEQQVPEIDELDGLDGVAVHLLAQWAGEPAGTLRLRQIDDVAKIERVCVAAPLRGKGIADALTVAALAEIGTWPGIAQIKLSAQVSVVGFYARHGFTAQGPVYDDAGMPHRDMVRAPGPTQ